MVRLARDPEQQVRVVERAGSRLGLAQQLDRRPPGRCPRPSPPRAWWWHGSPGARATGSQARATRIASRASRCASEKTPSSILSRASAARTLARSGLGSRGTSSTARRAARIAPAESPAARRTCDSRSYRRPEPDPVAACVEAGGGGLQVGGGAGRPADRVRRLGGPDLELGDVGRRAEPLPAGAGRTRPSVAGTDSASSRAASSSAGACRCPASPAASIAMSRARPGSWASSQYRTVPTAGPSSPVASATR